jgi:radical SAM superfamily enzyme YgiQ (UPF0313 family)
MIAYGRASEFRLTLVHPCVGRTPGKKYVRTWQMEPLPPATIAALTPDDVDVRFYDDRNEAIPFDEPTDLVAISLETYTARRAYQIASDYRRRGVPVVVGGFHAGLCPDEAARYAESVVIGEAEGIWPDVIDDYRHGTPRKFYRRETRPSLEGIAVDRSIFRGKRYVPIGLIETARGCNFACEFCAVQSYFNRTQTFRPIDEIVAEFKSIKNQRSYYFLVDDNLGSHPKRSIELFKAMAPLGIRWVSQCSINAAHDEEFLHWMKRAGCLGVLIGFESLDETTLKSMNKRFNFATGGYTKALANLRRAGVRVYGTFIFGYGHDDPSSCSEAVEFALDHGFFLAAFNHLMPFPGTPLYRRLKKDGRLLYDAWWLDKTYRYNLIPYRPKQMAPEELSRACIKARSRFYGWSSIFRRSLDRVNRADPDALRQFLIFNALHRTEVQQRNAYPLGDASWQGSLLPAAR